MPAGVWIGLLIMLVGMLGIAAALIRPRRDPPQVRFRLHIGYNSGEDGGVDYWWWQVTDGERRPDAQTVCSGASPTWRQAFNTGMFERNTVEQGWIWDKQNENDNQR